MTYETRPRLIAVLGCTGTVGAEVMRQLADHSCTVRGILRHPQRAYPVAQQDYPARVGYVTADYSSEVQLRQAFIGADAMFLLVGTNPEQIAIESRAIDAAQRAGIGRIIKLSVPVIAEPASVEAAKWHRVIEAKLAASGLEVCNLRPYAFMQNWLRNTTTIEQLGMIIGSADTAPRNYVDCRDVATIATQLLLTTEPLPSPAITLTGPEAITNQEMAIRLSLVTGSEVRYTNLSRADHYRMLTTQARLPEWLAQHIVELEELAIRIPEHATNTVGAYLGRYPRTMDEFLQEHRSAFIRKSTSVPVHSSAYNSRQASASAFATDSVQ